MRIGVCAALQVGTTVHARGFLRGVHVAASVFPRIRQAELIYIDDDACAEGGAKAAAAFLDAGVDVVIGHFASSSAAAAIGPYRDAGIPLLLPASTRGQLTTRDGTAFRVCASDRVLAARIVELLRARNVQRVHLASDDSLHGMGQFDALREAIGSDGPHIMPSCAGAEAVVYCGRLRASRVYLETQRAMGNRLPMYFTDDAASAGLIKDIGEPGEVNVVSFPIHMVDKDHPAVAAHADMFDGAPLLYTMETVAAFAAIEQAAGASQGLLAGLREEQFSTPLGTVRFLDGENLHARVSLWHFDHGELKTIRPLTPLNDATN